jgi:tetratricopeptide (TPR) repeat protein
MKPKRWRDTSKRSPLNPPFSRAYNDLGRLYLLRANARNWLCPFCRRGSSKSTTIPSALLGLEATLHKNLGWALLTQNQFPSAAAKHLEESLQLVGDRPAAYCLLAQVREGEDKLQQARDEWQQCDRYARERDRDLPEVQQWHEQARVFLSNFQDVEG